MFYFFDDESFIEPVFLDILLLVMDWTYFGPLCFCLSYHRFIHATYRIDCSMRIVVCVLQHLLFSYQSSNFFEDLKGFLQDPHYFAAFDLLF